MQSDWTVTQTLSFIADRYPPGSQQQALEDIVQKARSGEIKISGRRCAWRLGGGAIDVQVREEISALAWVDIALCRVADDWAAANANEHRAFQVDQDNKFSMIVRRTEREIRQGIRAILPPKHRTELEGWCSLRIDSADVMAAFSKTSSPTVQENIAFLVNYMAAGSSPKPSRRRPATSKARRWILQKRSQMEPSIQSGDVGVSRVKEASTTETQLRRCWLCSLVGLRFP